MKRTIAAILSAAMLVTAAAAAEAPSSWAKSAAVSYTHLLTGDTRDGNSAVLKRLAQGFEQDVYKRQLPFVC